jgi:hypothetical protein
MALADRWPVCQATCTPDAEPNCPQGIPGIPENTVARKVARVCDRSVPNFPGLSSNERQRGVEHEGGVGEDVPASPETRRDG